MHNMDLTCIHCTAKIKLTIIYKPNSLLYSKSSYRQIFEGHLLYMYPEMEAYKCIVLLRHVIPCKIHFKRPHIHVWVRPFLTNKIAPTWTRFDGQMWSGGPILIDKIGSGDQLCVRPFCHDRPMDDHYKQVSLYYHYYCMSDYVKLQCAYIHRSIATILHCTI